MNPLTNVRNIQNLNKRELELGVPYSQSWHQQYRDSAWIFIGGLDYDLTEGDLVCLFSQYGEVVNINLVRDKKTGKSKGFAFLCYENQLSTVLSVDNLNSIKLCGRTVRVDHVEEYRVPKMKEDMAPEQQKLALEGCAPQLMDDPASVTIPPPTTAQKLGDPGQGDQDHHVQGGTDDVKLPPRLFGDVKKEPESTKIKKKKSKKSKVKSKKSKKTKKSKKRKSENSSDSYSDSDSSVNSMVSLNKKRRIDRDSRSVAGNSQTDGISKHQSFKSHNIRGTLDYPMKSTTNKVKTETIDSDSDSDGCGSSGVREVKSEPISDSDGDDDDRHYSRLPARDSRGQTRVGRGETRDGRGDARVGRGETRDGRGDARVGRGETRDGRGDARVGRGETRDCGGNGRDTRGGVTRSRAPTTHGAAGDDRGRHKRVGDERASRYEEYEGGQYERKERNRESRESFDHRSDHDRSRR